MFFLQDLLKFQQTGTLADFWDSQSSILADISGVELPALADF